MQPFAEITEANRAIRTYLVHAQGKLPQDTYDQLEALFDSPSPVDVICRSSELLYARQGELDEDGKTLVGQLAAFAATNGWHGMADANRGGLIMQAMRRELGLKTEPGQAKPQAAEYDPEPIAAFVAVEASSTDAEPLPPTQGAG